MNKLSLVLCFGFLLTGCAGDKTRATSTSSAAETGIPPCDEYLAKVEKFVNDPNVPQITKDTYKQSLEQNRMAWKQAALTAQGKQQLDASCKMALDSAKPAFEQYGK
jgi:hypothetical protein